MRLRHWLCLLPLIALACADLVPTAPAHVHEFDGLETSPNAVAVSSSTGSNPLTATFANLPATHDGQTAFTFELRFSEEPYGLSYRTVRDHLFDVTNGEITRAPRATQGSNLAFVVTVQPSAASDISLSVRGTTDCEAEHAVCTEDGRMLAGGTSATVGMTDLITMSVADTEVEEAEGATLDFPVTLSRAAARKIEVWYKAYDGTATAGADYEAVSSSVAFAPGETTKTISVVVLDDAENERPETVNFWLWGVRGMTAAQVTDAYAVGTIRDSRSNADLEVGASVDDSSPETGGSFTLSATVTNSGDGASASTTLRYYRSSDATITSSDTQVGTDAVGALAAAGTSDQSVDLTAPSSAGTYYYGACVEAVTGESDTSNNCSASVRVDVEEPPPPASPDLEVGASVDESSPETGGSIALSATVTNSGDGASASTTLRYYRSGDATITSSDTQVGSDDVGALPAAGTSDQTVDLTAPSSAGTYYYGACVEAVTGESDTSNNCSASVRVDVEEPPPPTSPDLEVGASVDDASPETGGSITLSATVTNSGDEASASTTLRYYRSSDATITSSDTQVGSDDVGALAAAGTSDQSVDLTAPSSAGTYYYGACVEAVTGESDTSNNCSASVRVDVEEPPPPTSPDLEVGASVDDASPETGGSITLSATVTNSGDGASASTTVRYYRSSDATITSSDTQVGSDAVGALPAGGTSDQSVDLTAPSSAGTYYYGACVDAVAGESSTTNNCSGSVQVEVQEPGQTPVSVEVTGPREWAPVGGSVTYTARVLDSQGQEIHSAEVSWSSSDTDIATVDGNGVVTALAEGRATVSATAVASASASAQANTAGSARSFTANGANALATISGSLGMHVVKPVARIVLDPSSLSFDSIGAFQTITPTLYDADNNEMQPTYWGWSSADPEVAAVNSEFPGVRGSVRAIGAGTTTVTLRANGTGESATVTVTITGRRVETSPRSLTFSALGDTLSVTVRILDMNNNEDTTATFIPFSLFGPCCGPDVRNYPNGIAIEMVDGGFQVIARGPGTGQINISSAGAERAIVPVTVYMEPANLDISPDSLGLELGGTTTVRATLTDANGNSIHVADGSGTGGFVVYWESSDTTVATVTGVTSRQDNNTGATATVTAKAAGSATITARWANRITGTAKVTVTAGGG